jgi:hypothetical protein
VGVYSARIMPSADLAENVTYDMLQRTVFEYTLRAAFAWAFDQHDWEQEELRRKGLAAVELFHNGRAVWNDQTLFHESAAAFAICDATPDATETFNRSNELDPSLLAYLDRDICRRWELSGYLVQSVATEMKPLFEQLQADVQDRANEAREQLYLEVISTAFPVSKN